MSWFWSLEKYAEEKNHDLAATEGVLTKGSVPTLAEFQTPKKFFVFRDPFSPFFPDDDTEAELLDNSDAAIRRTG